MQRILSATQARAADQAAIAAGTPSVLLMKRAAQGLLEAVQWQGKIGVVCGAGNNAGDGYALAVLLRERGMDTTVVCLTDRQTADGAYFYNEYRKQGGRAIPYTAGCLMDFEMIADCILGIGLSAPPTGLFAAAIEEINHTRAYIVSADIPSGLHADSGLADLCVKADKTVAMGYFKTGEILNHAKDVTGELTAVDIGVCAVPEGEEVYLTEPGDFRTVIPPRPNACNKGDFGYVALMGGSLWYAGAAKLAHRALCALPVAALRSGCGVARLCVPQSIAHALLPGLLEGTLYPMPDQDGFMRFDPAALDGALAGTRAACVGMGWGPGQEYEKIIQYILNTYTGTLILDADALNTLAKTDLSCLKQSACKVVITPHPGEFARLVRCSVKDVLQNPIALAKQFARQTGVTVLLKGTATVITDGAQTYLCSRGCPGMATAGSGDVLCGILCGLFGYSKADAPLCAACGAYINGMAGEYAQAQTGPVGMLSSDTVGQIARAVRELTAQQDQVE